MYIRNSMNSISIYAGFYIVCGFGGCGCHLLTLWRKVNRTPLRLVDCVMPKGEQP